jgi:hypothetical protein
LLAEVAVDTIQQDVELVPAGVHLVKQVTVLQADQVEHNLRRVLDYLVEDEPVQAVLVETVAD